MDDIYTQILTLREQGKAAALVTVIRTKGSTPRESGSKMIVDCDGRIFGTIGGSSVEALIIEEAKQVIRKGKGKIVSHNLNDAERGDTGMVCGGIMEFFIEPLTTLSRLFIFGGGHVAKPLAQVASLAGFSYTLIDDRENFATEERFPDAREIIVGNPEEVANKMTFQEEDFITIVTRCHEHDYGTLKGVIEKSYRYLGLIGSRHKRKELFQRLKENDGISDELLNRVHSPIGLDIAAQTPEEIAVSITAELIAEKNRKK